MEESSQRDRQSSKEENEFNVMKMEAEKFKNEEDPQMKKAVEDVQNPDREVTKLEGVQEKIEERHIKMKKIEEKKEDKPQKFELNEEKSLIEKLNKRTKKSKKKKKKKKSSTSSKSKPQEKKPSFSYSKQNINYSNRPQDPELLEELEDYTETWNSYDLRDKMIASLKSSNKLKVKTKIIPNNEFLGKKNSLPFLGKKKVNSFTQDGKKIPYHVQRKINHDFNKIKESIEKQNIIQTSANFHSNLRLTFQEIGDLTKLKEKAPFVVENNLLFNTPQKLVKDENEGKIASFDCGNPPQNRKNLPVEEKCTRPIFLVRRPMSVKYNPDRGEILKSGVRNLRECDLWGLKGKIKGTGLNKTLRGASVHHKPKGKCLGLCEFYCGLRDDGMCMERCGAGDIGKKKSLKIMNNMVLIPFFN